MVAIKIKFEDINAEIARRTLGKDKWIKPLSLADTSVFGCAGGLHGMKGTNFYCPVFEVPSGHDLFLFFDIHNLTPTGGDIGVKITDGMTGETLMAPAYEKMDGFGHIRGSVYIPKSTLTKSYLLDIHLGIKSGGAFSEQSRFRVAIQVSGHSYVSESSADPSDIVYPLGDIFKVSDKPFPVATTMWLYVLGVKVGERKINTPLMPTIRFEGGSLRNTQINFFVMNAGYKQAKVDLRLSAFDTDEAYYKLTPIFDDMDLGYDKDTKMIWRNAISAIVPDNLKDNYAIALAWALGHQSDWWKPWDWKADEALICVWGRSPNLYLEVYRAGVVNFKPIGEDELAEYRKKLIEESIHRGAVGTYPLTITYNQKNWGGVLDTETVVPAYSPALPAIALAIIAASVAAAIIAIGFVIMNHEHIKYEELKMFQSEFDDSKFASAREQILYDQSHYPNEMKEAGKWGKKVDGKRRFIDPITGEMAPEYVDTPVDFFDWMKSRHPDWARDVYEEEEEEEEEIDIRKLATYTGAAIGIYIAGGILPEKFRAAKYAATIPGILAGYEAYKIVKEKFHL
ncbi:MAG: hypothetical protein J7J46_00820 [Candidatus Desulfofervidus sp.]|nr:hypothetical protein [Candidatus Desulfofervidus sp.]